MTYPNLILGTSCYGSRVGVSRSEQLIREAYRMGIRTFDTAPTYGSGYSESIIGGALQGREAIISTKYGQLDDRSVRGLTKKILRFSGMKRFRRSFNQFDLRDRSNEEFWSPKNAQVSYDRSRDHLENQQVGYFFLHSPNVPILGTHIEKLYEASQLKFKPAILGLAEPSMDDILKLSEGYKSSVFKTIQLSLRSIIRCCEKKPHFNLKEVWVNQIFAYKNSSALLDPDSDKFFDDLKMRYFSNPGWKAVVGCTTMNSVSKLPKLYERLFVV